MKTEEEIKKAIEKLVKEIVSINEEISVKHDSVASIQERIDLLEWVLKQ